MRELEFLPSWYPRLRRRKRVAVLQGWLLLVTVAALGVWVGLAQRNVRAASATLQGLQHEVDQTHAEQNILAEKLTLRRQLQEREQLIASIGFPVQMTRLLQKLDSVMPKEMSLVDFTCELEEQARPAAGARSGADNKPQIDRRLKVNVKGVTPSEVDLANFLAGLTNVSFFDQVTVKDARNRVESGHVMREFEVTFSMNLNQQPGI